MEPVLRSAQVLKQEAEDIGLTGKDVAEYATRQQTFDREKRADEIRMAEIQADAQRLQAEVKQSRRDTGRREEES